MLVIYGCQTICPEFSSENSNLVTPVFLRVQAQLRFEKAATTASPGAVFTV